MIITCWGMTWSRIVHGAIIQFSTTMKIVTHGLKTNINVSASTPDAKVVKNEIGRFLRS